MPKLLSNLGFPARSDRPAALRGVVEVALVLLLAAQAARLLWLLLTPLGPVGTASATSSPPVPETSLSLSGNPFFPAAKAGRARASALGYRLFGVRRTDGGGAAILAAADGAQGAFHVGDEIADGVVLQAVGADHVVLRAGGTDHRVALHDSAPATTVRTASAATPAATLPTASATDGGDAAIDPQQLLAQAGLRARTEGGRVTGYTLIPRGGGALLRQAGLESGDVLLAVNGQALTPERMTELEQELARRDRAEITVRRDGETKTITLRTTSP